MPVFITPTALNPIGSTNTFNNHCFVCGRFGKRWQSGSRKFICQHTEGEVQWYDYDIPTKPRDGVQYYASWDITLIDMSLPTAPNHP